MEIKLWITTMMQKMRRTWMRSILARESEIERERERGNQKQTRISCFSTKSS
jgi:hypothetical protein